MTFLVLTVLAWLRVNVAREYRVGIGSEPSAVRTGKELSTGIRINVGGGRPLEVTVSSPGS